MPTQTHPFVNNLKHLCGVVKKNLTDNPLYNKRQDFFLRFYQHLPDHIYGGDDKSHKRLLAKKTAITKSYITINSPWWIQAIILDVDYPHVGERIQALRMPQPTYICYNRQDRRSHAVYLFGDAIPWKQKTKATQRLLKATAAALQSALGADKAITWQRQTTKNPWREDQYEVAIWGGLYQLSALYYMIPCEYREVKRELPQPRPVAPLSALDKYVDARGSRNCAIFDSVRHQAYCIVGGYRDYGSFHQAVAEAAEAANRDAGRLFQDRGSLPMNDIKHLAKSIASWTWKHRGSICAAKVQRGTMGFKPMAGLSRAEYKRETKRRQGKAAKRTNTMRRSATERVLETAIKELHRNGKMVTAAELTRITGKGKSTIYRYLGKIPSAVSVCTLVGCGSSVLDPLKDLHLLERARRLGTVETVRGDSPWGIGGAPGRSGTAAKPWAAAGRTALVLEEAAGELDAGFREKPNRGVDFLVAFAQPP